MSEFRSDDDNKNRLFNSPLIWVGLILVALIAIATQKDGQRFSLDGDGLYRPFEGGSLAGDYLSGRYASLKGDLDKASSYLTDALAADADNPELLSQTYRSLLLVGDFDRAIELAERVQDSELRMFPPALLLMAGYTKQGELEDARLHLDEVEQDGLYGFFVPVVDMWLDVDEDSFETPKRLHTLVRNANNFAPFIYFHLGLAHDYAGMNDKARKFYENSVNLSESIPYRLVEMLSNYYVRAGDPEAAKAIYTRYIESREDSYSFRGYFYKDPTEFGASEPIIGSVQDGMAEVFFTVGTILYGIGAVDDALVNLQLALYLNPGLTPAQLLLASIHELRDQYMEAIAFYERVPVESPYFFNAQVHRVFAYQMAGEKASALKHIDQLITQYPDHHELFMARADMLRSDSRYREAIEYYSKAIDLLPELKSNYWALFYSRGICYERDDQWDLAEADLRKALELQPSQPDVLNYLGYSLLIAGKKIEEAKGMIEEAIAARPQDAHIVDSMGWALYVLGEFEESVKYLERAAALDASDATIYDHLGDVYWRLGRKLEARYQWQRALVFDPEDTLKVEIEKKLEDGLGSFTLPEDVRAGEDSASTETTSGADR